VCVCLRCGEPCDHQPRRRRAQPAVTALPVPPPQGSWLHELERWEEEEVDRLTRLSMTPASGRRRAAAAAAEGGAPPQSATAAAAEPSPREAPPAFRPPPRPALQQRALVLRVGLSGGGGGESFRRVHWVAVPKAVRARRVNRRRRRRGSLAAVRRRGRRSGAKGHASLPFTPPWLGVRPDCGLPYGCGWRSWD
jgi:hypothetical protein